jgi:hypothetical protein
VSKQARPAAGRRVPAAVFVLLGVASCAAVVALALLDAQTLAAQFVEHDAQVENAINYSNTAIQGLALSLFKLARYLIVGVCLVLGLWELFKGARSNSRSWILAFGYFVVAGAALGPADLFRLVGLGGLATWIETRLL